MLSQESKNYVYSSLRSYAKAQLVIRVLVLLPAEDQKEILRCELAEVSLLENPKYEAISYCWEDPATTQVILCDGARLHLTMNLKMALRHLRQPKERRNLWADAVCINQTDLLERSEQVQIMKDIYSRAASVLVWLGEITPSSAMALSLVEGIYKANTDIMIASMQASPKYSYPQGFSQDQINTGVFCLRELLRRPWFRRIWVVQEVAVANSVIVMCGQNSISWDHLILSLGVIDYMGLLTTHNSIDFGGFGLSILINDARLIYQNISKEKTTNRQSPAFPTSPRSLTLAFSSWRRVYMRNEEMLTFPMWFRRMLASDPRDKLFALYGLTDSLKHPVHFTINYQKDVADAYQQFTIKLLRDTHNLDILSITRRTSESLLDLPSWVADWSDSDASDVALIGQIASRFRATGNSRYHAKFLKQYTILVVDCHFIDRISDVGLDLGYKQITYDHPTSMSKSGISRHLDTTAYYQKVLASWERTIQRVPQISISGEDKESAYRKTLTAAYGRSNSATAAYKNWRRASWFMRMLPFLEPQRNLLLTKVAALSHMVSSSFQLLGVWVRERTNRRRSLFELIINQQQAFERYLTMAFGRKIARTGNGFIALVPAGAQSGDSVALCKGGKTPVILRPYASTWKLIGDCYVHGIMDGEAFDEGKCKEACII